MTTYTADPHERILLVRNRTAAVGWVFMSVWLAMMGMFTYLFYRDGGMHQFGYEVEAAIIAVFWIGGIGGFAHFASVPVIRVEREGSQLIVTERRVFRIAVTSVLLSDVHPPTLVEGRDDEGSPYFRAEMSLSGSHRVTVAEGHHRVEVQKKAEQVTAALATR